MNKVGFISSINDIYGQMLNNCQPVEQQLKKRHCKRENMDLIFHNGTDMVHINIHCTLAKLLVSTGGPESCNIMLMSNSRYIFCSYSERNLR